MEEDRKTMDRKLERKMGEKNMKIRAFRNFPFFHIPFSLPSIFLSNSLCPSCDFVFNSLKD